MTRPILAAALALVATAATANAVVLYDGSLGTTPEQQGLTYLAIGAATNTPVAGGTTLDTTAVNGTYAGFGTNAVTLDRTAGFSFRIDARVLSEAHASTARAGFSVLLITSDLKAIELGFHADENFAQAAVTSDSRGEDVAFDTTAALTRYDVAVVGTDYTLRANGTPILTGPLRDYTDFGGPPYTVPNSIFFGDDSTRARAATTFSYVAVTAVPEPTTFAAIAGAGIAMLRRRRA